jgi:hypothetical protein
LVTWIDGNAPYHDGFVNKRPQRPAYSLPTDTELIREISSIHERRCGSCHKTPEISRPDWVDIHRPAQSLFLTAPLEKSAGGTGKCGKVTYRNCEDVDYKAVLRLVADAVEEAWKNPRRDLMALQEEWTRK